MEKRSKRNGRSDDERHSAHAFGRRTLRSERQTDEMERSVRGRLCFRLGRRSTEIQLSISGKKPMIDVIFALRTNV